MSPQLVHRPYGIEDPYTAQPWERTPREPGAGDLVTVAAISQPAGAVQSVAIEVTAAGGDTFAVPAGSVPFESDGDRWEGALGSFPAGCRVTYRWVARLESGETITAGPFSFDTSSWHPLGSVSSWEAEPARVLLHPGDGGATVSLEMIGHGALRLQAWPAATQPGPGPSTALPCVAHEDSGTLIIRGAGLEICVDLASGAVRLRSEDWPEDVPSLSSGTGALLAWLGTSAGGPHAVRLRLSLTQDEALYGTGERFDRFDRRGLSFDTRVYEQYKNQGSRTYLPIPLVLSSRGYAVSVEGTRPLHIDAGAADEGILDIVADVARDESACLTVLVFLGAGPLDALEAHLCHSDLPAMPPEWSFGLWMSANDWNSQERVMREVERAEREGIPGDVVVIEAWSDEATFYIWNDAEYAPIPPDRPPRLSDFRFPPHGRWPDPKGMIDALHARGTRLLLWQIPLIKPAEEPHAQLEADTHTLIARKWSAQNPDGTPYRNPGWWFPGALLPDLTNPEAVDWWLSRRRYLVEELEVDGFKTDGGEHLWGRDVSFADGRRGDEMINAFPVLYAAAYHRLLRSARRDGMTFSRAGYAGSQRYPAHWAGDENSTWEAFRHSITAGLSAGASGIPFWGWDIAGFSEEIPSGELYRRAWMMATFCPIMQYHSEYNAQREPSRDRTPWNIAARSGDPYVLPVCRFYAAARRLLKPYLVREAHHTSETGRPLMCALPLAFPGDLACRAHPYEYLFGRDLLVAPTVEEGATTQLVYLPAEDWRDLWTGEALRGPLELTVDVPPDHIPVYVRPDAASPLDLPLRSVLQGEEYEPVP